MKSYKVTWDIDIDADSPREAALKAQVIQRDPQSTATCFDVFEQVEYTSRRGFTEAEDGMQVHVDLSEPYHVCDNCGACFTSEQIVEEIKRLSERVDENGPTPSGECPDCGALVYEHDA